MNNSAASEKDNRRRIERFSMSIPSKVSSIMHDYSGQELATTNISAGGVFFETGQTYPVGTEVTLNISLDFGGMKAGQPAIQVPGRRHRCAYGNQRHGHRL
jgi:LuxR family transcriptional regulator, positive regulator of biofilm formation